MSKSHERDKWAVTANQKAYESYIKPIWELPYSWKFSQMKWKSTLTNQYAKFRKQYKTSGKQLFTSNPTSNGKSYLPLANNPKRYVTNDG